MISFKKKKIIQFIRNFFRKLKSSFVKEKDYKSDIFWLKNMPEIDEDSKYLIELVGNHTMTPLIRRWALIKAIHYINKKNLEGDIVESGVWRGGNLFLSKRVQDKYYPDIKRSFYGYDTFEGMPKPSINDGLEMNEWYENFKRNKTDWAKASLEDVIESSKFFFSQTDSFKFIKGKVEKTLNNKDNLPNKISLLRLDTDWYESTKIELETLYPLIVDNGVLIIDDYGDMPGCRKAVDEFFKNKDILLNSIDRSCRIIIKN